MLFRSVLEERQLVARTGWRPADVRATLESLVEAGKLQRLATPAALVASLARLSELRAQTLATVDSFHQKEPLLDGIAKEELRKRVFGAAPEALLEAVLGELVQAGELLAAGDRVKRAGRAITLSAEEEQAKQASERAFAQAGLKVPAVKDVLTQVKVEPKRAQKIITILLREGVLTKVSEELLFHRTALEALSELLRRYKQQKGDRLSVPAFKELTSVSRKYAIPLLEYLDRQRLTRRVGDERVILL